MLACYQYKWSLSEFIEHTYKYISHFHLADASGNKNEGLQIGEGQIDFGSLSSQLKKLCPNSSFIPEIWQGHKNMGEGFWIALNKLEKEFSLIC